MYTDRPKIQVPLEMIDRILEFLTLAILICLWVFVVMKYQSLPEIVPTHFNAQGQVDGTGSKNSIWILMAITTAITVGLHVLTKFPHVHNYMVNITKENAMHNYKMSARLLRVVNLLTLLVMGFVALAVVQAATGENLLMGSSFMYIIVTFAVIMPIGLVIYNIKNQKKATTISK